LVLILGNLLDNSFEALSGRDLAEVHCYILQGNDLVISVEDTGPGINDVIIDRLFDWRFTTKEALNHGIGLSLVKNALKSLDGTIELETGAWGTRFLVKIPLLWKEPRA
jgi:two-component system sensor histidine kinase DctS